MERGRPLWPPPEAGYPSDFSGLCTAVRQLQKGVTIPPPRPPHTTTPFDRAATRLLAAQATGGSANDDYRIVSSTLIRFARKFGLSPEDAEDAVAETLTGTLARADDRTIRQPGAYLFWTTRNRALDQLRRAQLRPTDPLETEELENRTGRQYSEEDDAIARTLDKRATAEMIDTALRAATAAKDTMVARVVPVWLELAEEHGEAPKSREVAREAETSHTTVNKALQRFRAYLPPDASLPDY